MIGKKIKNNINKTKRTTNIEKKTELKRKLRIKSRKNQNFQN